MTREQAIQLTQLYDNQLPEDYVGRYLEYYKMERSEFDDVIDKWANKELFQKIDGRWCPTFEIV